MNSKLVCELIKEAMEYFKSIEALESEIQAYKENIKDVVERLAKESLEEPKNLTAYLKARFEDISGDSDKKGTKKVVELGVMFDDFNNMIGE